MTKLQEDRELRDQKIWQTRLQGKTYRQIGDLYKLSKGQVQIICWKRYIQIQAKVSRTLGNLQAICQYRVDDIARVKPHVNKLPLNCEWRYSIQLIAK